MYSFLTEPLSVILFKCTFEDSCDALVQEEADDNFNWKFNYGATASSDTGPNYDHTTGDLNGK